MIEQLLYILAACVIYQFESNEREHHEEMGINIRSLDSSRWQRTPRVLMDTDNHLKEILCATFVRS
jgi:hypothetical protein